ncbi:hypothetical protein ARMGADRAFT_1060126 [Armillaria gallica]|uniref:Uncharacterized protein n=1 Tax=Armillaria gallica TaxID=47427 RepID=A0A2H3E511_ARMGA|nr:hypothetical protein ARMGADRAFT_1060126 [Armillaria gallica]
MTKVPLDVSADAVYDSIKLETPPTVCSTQAASASEEEASRFMFFEFDRVAKGDGKGTPLLCLAEWNGTAVTGLAKLDYSPLFTRCIGPYLRELACRQMQGPGIKSRCYTLSQQYALSRGWRTVVPGYRVGFTRDFGEQGQNFKKETFAGVATCPGIDQKCSMVLQPCQTRILQVQGWVLQEEKGLCRTRSLTACRRLAEACPKEAVAKGLLVAQDVSQVGIPPSLSLALLPSRCHWPTAQSTLTAGMVNFKLGCREGNARKSAVVVSENSVSYPHFASADKHRMYTRLLGVGGTSGKSDNVPTFTSQKAT